jgi:hypothetical protein
MNKLWFAATAIGYCIALPASASNWVRVSNSNTADFYVDTESIRHAGQNRKAWIMANATDAQAANKGGGSGKMLEYFDCEQKMIGYGQSITYALPMGEGNVINSSSAAIRYEDIIPDSVSEFLFNYVCRWPLPPKRIR